MKTALILLSTLLVLGCSSDDHGLAQNSPIPPPVEQEPLASLWGMVVGESGACIEGATVTVVDGQGLGQSIEQTTDCDAWGYEAGFVFRNLTPGVAMTLRATAPGYGADERSVVPSLEQYTAFVMAPPKLP